MSGIPTSPSSGLADDPQPLPESRLSWRVEPLTGVNCASRPTSRGNPKQVTGLADLARGDIRFVNRQPGSGTRMLIDLLLRRIGVDPDRVNGYASAELTHSAIAAFVASGMADVGFGVAPAAHHFGLDFIEIADEDYYFACDRGHLAHEPLATVLGLLRGARFRASVAQLEGYDPAACGDVVELDAAWGGPREDEQRTL